MFDRTLYFLGTRNKCISCTSVMTCGDRSAAEVLRHFGKALHDKPFQRFCLVLKVVVSAQQFRVISPKRKVCSGYGLLVSSFLNLYSTDASRSSCPDEP